MSRDVMRCLERDDGDVVVVVPGVVVVVLGHVGDGVAGGRGPVLVRVLVTCHVSHVTCHMSRVTCHISRLSPCLWGLNI